MSLSQRFLLSFPIFLAVFLFAQAAVAEEESNLRVAVKEWARRAAVGFEGVGDVGEKDIPGPMQTEMVAMRDGTHLATDLYRPLLSYIGVEYPAVLLRTPYDKDDLSALGYALATAGFVGVIQDVRGTFDSEGENRSFYDDGWGIDGTGTHWDGYDTVEWVADRSWCDGEVGMLGFSALGISASFAAGSLPPHLKCQVLFVSASDLYHDAAHQGGGYRLSLVEEWLDSVGAIPEVQERVIQHESYDDEWTNASILLRHPTIDVPVYHSGGWYDIFLQGTLNHFSGLQENGAGAARGNQKLIIGPWTHSGQETREQGQLTYPANSVISTDEFDNALDWFSYWLEGETKSVLDLPNVRYYLMGAAGEEGAPGNQWRESDKWPVPSQEGSLYLLAGGDLKGEKSTVADSSTSFAYDPANPVPTIGGANLNLDAGPYDQRSIEGRGDVLVFTSPVLTEPLEVVGRITVSLFASSPALDTDWTAKLCDVYPDGRSMLVTDGLRRAKFRNGFETPEPLDPGTVYEFEIDLWSTAIVFNAGHRIRVDISSSNSPRFDPNPNTGDPLRQNAATLVATNTVHHSRSRPSRLILPVTAPENHPLFPQEETMGVSSFFLY
jgi:predicted acyl esterase